MQPEMKIVTGVIWLISYNCLHDPTRSETHCGCYFNGATGSETHCGCYFNDETRS